MPAKRAGSSTSSRKNLKPTISIVGPGRLGSALAVALHQADFQIDEIVVRSPGQARGLARAVGAKAITAQRAALESNVVWLTVGDSIIRQVADVLAAARGGWGRQTVFHSSGALTSDELSILKAQGATVASVHPLMTFNGSKPPSLVDVFFGLEGEMRAVRTAEVIVQALGGVPMRIRPEHKAAYHTWAAFGSPMLIALLAAAEQAARLAGLDSRESREALVPLVQQTLDNYALGGPEAAFTGPLIRGDTGTIAKHLEVLQTNESVRDAYVALARIALESLPVGKKHAMAGLLKNVARPKRSR
jgi:predicted short-subunit dehydrogenase-like oxidoreductase (DUF2520 family)